MASPQTILKWWEMKYHQLSVSSRDRFISDERVLELQQFQASVVQEAISKHWKLDDILGEAKAIRALWNPAPQHKGSNFPMIRNPQTGRGN